MTSDMTEIRLHPNGIDVAIEHLELGDSARPWACTDGNSYSEDTTRHWRRLPRPAMSPAQAEAAMHNYGRRVGSQLWQLHSSLASVIDTARRAQRLLACHAGEPHRISVREIWGSLAICENEIAIVRTERARAEAVTAALPRDAHQHDNRAPVAITDDTTRELTDLARGWLTEVLTMETRGMPTEAGAAVERHVDRLGLDVLDDTYIAAFLAGWAAHARHAALDADSDIHEHDSGDAVEVALDRIGTLMSTTVDIPLTLQQFLTGGRVVHASPDGRLAAVENGLVVCVVDTATGETVPADGLTGDRVDDVLRAMSELDIPWGDRDALAVRWGNPEVLDHDRQTIAAIMTGSQPPRPADPA